MRKSYNNEELPYLLDLKGQNDDSGASSVDFCAFLRALISRRPFFVNQGPISYFSKQNYKHFDNC